MNSLLSELLLSTYETWLLPHAETLCVIWYLEEIHGSATPNGQDGEDTKFNGQEERPLETPSHRTTDASRTSDAWRLQPTSQVPAFACYSGRTTDADRTSDTSQRPDNRASPDDRRHHTRAKTSEEWRLPDDRTTDLDRTTDNS